MADRVVQSGTSVDACAETTLRPAPPVSQPPETVRAFTATQAKDIACHIHAQTNLATHERIGPIVMVRGEGVYTWDENGKRYLDAMSGMWSASLGFSEERLVEAATRQMRQLPFHQNFSHR